jgi:hypothetical protein
MCSAVVLSACEAGADQAVSLTGSSPLAPTTPTTLTPVATTNATPPAPVDSVHASSLPHGASQPHLVDDDLATLNRIGASGRFGVDAQGRVPVLLALPDEFAGLDRFVIYPAAETGYGIVFSSADGPPVTAPGTARAVSIRLIVNEIDDDTRESQQQFFTDHQFQSVALGPTTVAWVGSDATPSCPPAPEDGSDATVLSWYHAACTGFELATPDCKTPYS